jgi:4a-hydroxytetrahydrobiopterin dehydratase
MKKLTETEITARLAALPEWQISAGELDRTFQFEDFIAALRFVNAVADLAEAAQHHPDIDIRYNRVRLRLVTHDAGGLTTKDFDLAEAVSKLSQIAFDQLDSLPLPAQNKIQDLG